MSTQESYQLPTAPLANDDHTRHLSSNKVVTGTMHNLLGSKCLFGLRS